MAQISTLNVLIPTTLIAFFLSLKFEKLKRKHSVNLPGRRIYRGDLKISGHYCKRLSALFLFSEGKTSLTMIYLILFEGLLNNSSALEKIISFNCISKRHYIQWQTHYLMKLPYKNSLTWIFPEAVSTAEIHLLFLSSNRGNIFKIFGHLKFYLIDLIVNSILLYAFSNCSDYMVETIFLNRFKFW